MGYAEGYHRLLAVAEPRSRVLPTPPNPADTAIVGVETEIVSDQFNPQLLVHIHTVDGYTGTGETWWGNYLPNRTPGTPVLPIASVIDELLASVVIGASPAEFGDIEMLWHQMVVATHQYGVSGITSIAISGIDLALWDIVAQRKQVPVHEVLGPRVHDRIPAYASLTWHNSVDAILADVERAVAAGFQAVKLHQRTLDGARAVRQHFGDDLGIMFDASCRLSEREAYVMGEALADMGVLWLEEPLHAPVDRLRLAGLRSAVRIPIAAGENSFTADEFDLLMAGGAVDLVQPDLVKAGGLTAGRTIADLAASYGISVCPHNFSLGPSLWANIHWGFTIPGVTWLEVPWLPEGGTFPTDYPMPAIIDGAIMPPTKPGLSAG